jgi:osmotically-inducible protein OsmY
MILNTAHFDLQAGTEILVEAIRQMESQESGNSLSERLKNMAFAKRVEAGLKKRLVTPFHRQIEVAGTPSGTITLTGYVSNEESRTLAEQVASEMEGVV